MGRRQVPNQITPAFWDLLHLWEARWGRLAAPDRRRFLHSAELPTLVIALESPDEGLLIDAIDHERDLAAIAARFLSARGDGSRGRVDRLGVPLVDRNNERCAACGEVITELGRCACS